MSSLLASDKAFVPCRVESRAHDAERGVGPGAGGNWPAAAHHEQHARREGPAVKAGGARACAERTWNMLRMFVTLDVSKLSGWLNADACCRESNGGHSVWGEVCPGRREAAGDRGARSVQGRARLQIGSRARGGAHGEHLLHGCDVGGVEAQRLVERRRGLPRVERRAYGAWRGCGPADGGDGVQRAGEGSTADWGRATGRSARKTSGSCL